ncbi:uncharacterized protein BYT42DRAFT_583854, partial [Radiomyces spectabilis]|uniref:uncharacterized protein n=1 Tax=Radiomyces spectabilis TaxID=64574 RepID=UPI00221EC939
MSYFDNARSLLLDAATFFGAEHLLHRHEDSNDEPRRIWRDAGLAGAAAYAIHKWQEHEAAKQQAQANAPVMAMSYPQQPQQQPPQQLPQQQQMIPYYPPQQYHPQIVDPSSSRPVNDMWTMYPPMNGMPYGGMPMMPSGYPSMMMMPSFASFPPPPPPPPAPMPMHVPYPMSPLWSMSGPQHPMMYGNFAAQPPLVQWNPYMMHHSYPYM